MIFRRISSHIREQNWFGLFLDLFVVVIGIFLAFQVDRWYENIRLQDNVNERLTALAKDFANNRDLYQGYLDGTIAFANAASMLLIHDFENSDEIDHEEFYRLLGRTSRTGSPTPVRRAYDALISTGEIELIGDETLKADLASFYALSNEIAVFMQGAWLFDRNVFEPYVMRELDFTAMLRTMHGSRTQNLDPSREVTQFLSVVDSHEFRAVIAIKWHIFIDVGDMLERNLVHIKSIEVRIDENLDLPAK